MKAEENGGRGVVDPQARSQTSSSFILHPSSFSQTLAGTVMGTPQYMSPEQARGEVETLDARSDIYALGAILYHLLALRPSVTGDDAWAIVGKVGRGEIEPLKKEGVPDSLAAVVRKAMSFDMAKRYPRVELLQADVIAYQNGFATSAEKAGAWKQFSLFVRRHKAASIGVAAVLLIGGTLGSKAIVEGRRAESALRELQETAPAFQAQAIGLLNDGNFEEALKKIGFAIKLNSKVAEYRVFRGNLLQATERLPEAATDYREALRLWPDDKATAENLTLCEGLLRENGSDAPLTRPVQLKLLAALRQQKRLVEAAPLNALIEPDIATAEAALRARLRSYSNQPGWTSSRVRRVGDGSFSVNLNNLELGDLSLLHAQPISILEICGTNLADLRPLAKLSLQSLKIIGTLVTDLTPLKGMPLESLSVSMCQNLKDLTGLEGLPLRDLSIDNTSVADLGPLKNLPLEKLNAAVTRIRSLEALRGLPLQSLQINNCFNVEDLGPLADCHALETLWINQVHTRDLRPLAHLPLKFLYASQSRMDSLEPLRGRPLEVLHIGKTEITDLSPLLDCPTLRDLVIPDKATNIQALRKFPNLQRLSRKAVGSPPTAAQTVEEFLAEYDAQQQGEAQK